MTGSNCIAISGDLLPISLKHKLLLFDQVLLVNLAFTKCLIHGVRHRHTAFEEMINDIEYLEDHGLLRDAGDIEDATLKIMDELKETDTPLMTSVDFQMALIAINAGLRTSEAFKDALATTPTSERNTKMIEERRNIKITEAVGHLTTHAQFASRVLANSFRSKGVDATPVISESFVVPDQWKSKGSFQQTNLTDVVLKNLPVPSDMTPWEQIIDFRNDPEARGYLAGLRLWMAETSRMQLPLREAEEKLEWLLFQQSQHLKAHRIESTMGTFGAVFVATVEALENLARIRWGKVARDIVALTNRRAELLKSEMAGPARELNFIIRAKDQFGEC
ncbi:hypothetical protein ACQR0Z_14910 [Bradyrhizobium sp. HKCCYLS3077]|uniref:hypothetical protein n=1 Tax=Bradyrhizobium sp. HKCCYLS3077 TaxID=3420761 RepID=UPI003EC14882